MTEKEKRTILDMRAAGKQYCFRNILLLRGASVDYQKQPSFSTNLQLRFLSASQPMVARSMIPDAIETVSKRTAGTVLVSVPTVGEIFP